MIQQPPTSTDNTNRSRVVTERSRSFYGAAVRRGGTPAVRDLHGRGAITCIVRVHSSMEVGL